MGQQSRAEESPPIGEQGEGLIFLLSQPRAGSTLLQRMLGAHSAVHTTQEPWIALHPIYALRSTGYEAEYGAAGARLFTREFMATLPRGQAGYEDAIRLMLLDLYRQALVGREAQRFVDKTPRYYLIIPDLVRLFPRADFVFLFRNPLAVLASVLESWVRGSWLGVAHARLDLLEAPARLLAGRALAGERAHCVHYESLVQRPESTSATLAARLSLTWEPELVEYGRAEGAAWQYGDRRSVYRHERPVPAYLDRWHASLAEPQKWRLLADYLAYLGEGTVRRMGYDPVALAAVLERQRPSAVARAATFPLEWLLRRPPAERPAWQRHLVRVAQRVQPFLAR